MSGISIYFNYRHPWLRWTGQRLRNALFCISVSKPTKFLTKFDELLEKCRYHQSSSSLKYWRNKCLYCHQCLRNWILKLFYLFFHLNVDFCWILIHKNNFCITPKCDNSGQIQAPWNTFCIEAWILLVQKWLSEWKHLPHAERDNETREPGKHALTKSDDRIIFIDFCYTVWINEISVRSDRRGTTFVSFKMKSVSLCFVPEILLQLICACRYKRTHFIILTAG